MAKSALHSYQPSTNIRPTALGLIFESRVDMKCDTDLNMYFTLFITSPRPSVMSISTTSAMSY